MKTKPAKDKLPVLVEPARPERLATPPPQHEKRTLIIHNFQWHRIIAALALLILAVAAVV